MKFNEKEYIFIFESNQFDRDWYIENYSLPEGVDPIVHYLTVGADMGFNPNAFFDTKWYLMEYSDVRKSNINPFVHYIKFGIKENRKPKKLSLQDIDDWAFDLIKDDYFTILNSNLFDCAEYIENYSLPEGVDPIVHYLTVGADMGFNPNAFFDTKWYLMEYSDVRKSNINPFVHYINNGFYECRLTKIFTLKEIEIQNLNLSLKGRYGWIFLYNDSNNEIKQHFDKYFKNFFNKDLFEKNLRYKKYIFNKNNINYFYFLVPDKSVVCRDLLPFKYDIFKRNIDQIEYFIDFVDYLDINHYFKYDSHLNYFGGKVLSFCLLNTLDKSMNLKKYNHILSKNSNISVHKIYDLVSSRNWSYSNDEKKYIPSNGFESAICSKRIKICDDEIPMEFRYCGGRKSHFLKNDSSFYDLKVLIFHDSSVESIFWYLTPFFKEMMLYWDHGSIDKKLIKLFKPDLILEIRIERFLDNMITSPWINNQENLY